MQPALGPAELTVVVVSATRCEPAAIVLTAPRGIVLFFSMATTSAPPRSPPTA